MSGTFDEDVLDQVLFVDDDPETLNAILLEVSACDFDMYLAESCDQGLQVLSNRSIDLVVADVKVSDSGGVGFLAEIKKNFPNMHRVVLYAASEEHAAAKLVASGYATASISKPWDEGKLKESVEHILRMRNTLKQKRLLESINKIERLPSLPSLYQEFTEAVLNDRPVKEIAPIIEADVSLSARLLQIANSAFFGTNSIYSVEQAVVRLGTNTVKDLVMTFSFVNDLKWTPEQLTHLQQIFRHSTTVNRFMKEVFRIKFGRALKQSEACIGITHDIGKIVILQYFPDRYQTIVDHQKDHPGFTFFESEEALAFDWFKHAEVGAYFLNMWNLPDAIVEATLFHHAPAQAGEATREVVEVLSFVNDLVARVELLGAAGDLEDVRYAEGFIPEDAAKRVTEEIHACLCEPVSCA